ncbi:MAG: transglutaminase-like domain-containing protein [Clostridiales bacterium]|nr:transglutaminase-like domain-containing protein [Clostridiales bacterium]MDD6292761.1 transglutaminase-like domain-containing protein [Eubacteriales bacterium]
MENKFKISDFIGKSLIISLGIIATVCGFIDMFNIPASKVAVSIFTICITFLLMTTSRARHKHIAMIGIFITVILLILINWNGIKCGIYFIANRIIDAYNYYAGITESDMFIIDFGKPIFFSSTKQSVTFTLCMIIIEYAYILVTASIYKVFSSIHILLSVGITFVGLFLGLFPGTIWTILMIAYYILCVMYGRNRHIYIRRMIFMTGIITVVTLFTLIIARPKNYDENKYLKYREMLENIAQKFNLDISSDTESASSDGKSSMAYGGINGGRLGNVDEVKNTGLEMLRVNMAQTDNNIYLKGFVGNEYDRNKWTEINTDNLKGLVDITGIMGGRSNSLVTDYDYIEEFYEGKPADKFEIRYLKDQRKYRYMPYYVNQYYSDNEKEMRLSTDYSIGNEVFNVYDISLDEAINMIKDDEISLEEFSEFTNISCGISDEVAEVLAKEMMDSPVYDGTAASLIDCIKYVQKYLSANAIYTLSPGALDKGDDFIVDFLTVKKAGYCTSFASAGVMMFRYMGIPARYVEGYVITSSDQTRLDNGEVQAIVKDESAHAWPEIYIAGLGFVPVEVTPGYFRLSDGVDNVAEPTTTSPENTSDETSSEVVENSTTDKENTSKETTIKNGKIETDKKTDKKNDKNIIIIFALLAAVAILLIVSVKIYNILQHKGDSKESDYNTDDLRHNMDVLTVVFEKLLTKAGIDYSINRSTSDICKDINELIGRLNKADVDKDSKYTKSGGIIPDTSDTEEVIRIIYRAKYSDENAEFTEKDTDKLHQYVEEFKNSLQYFKNKV